MSTQIKNDEVLTVGQPVSIYYGFDNQTAGTVTHVTPKTMVVSWTYESAGRSVTKSGRFRACARRQCWLYNGNTLRRVGS